MKTELVQKNAHDEVEQRMKARVIKKRIRRYVTWYAKNKIPKAFKDKRERNEWIEFIVSHHVQRLPKVVKWDD